MVIWPNCWLHRIHAVGTFFRLVFLYSSALQLADALRSFDLCFFIQVLFNSQTHFDHSIYVSLFKCSSTRRRTSIIRSMLLCSSALQLADALRSSEFVPSLFSVPGGHGCIVDF